MKHLASGLDLAAFGLAVLKLFIASILARHAGPTRCQLGVALDLDQHSRKRSLVLQPFVLVLFGLSGYLYVGWER